MLNEIFKYFFVSLSRESIVRHLGIPDGLNGVISDVPLPDNLLLTISKDENRDAELLALLRSAEFINNRSIIIYCGRRDECNRVADYIRTCMQVNYVQFCSWICPTAFTWVNIEQFYKILIKILIKSN